MLHEALLVAARHAQVEQEKVATTELLNQLPLEVLKEIASTGEVKLAYGPCSSEGGSESWVSQFKGTPFFQQAIALEQEDLQAQTANQQSSAVQRQKMDQEYAAQDQIRLKKKLLELQKARNEAQVLDAGAGAPAAAGSPDPAGTAPGGPAGPPMEDLKTVTASLRKAAMDAGLFSKLKATAGAPALKGALTNVGTKPSQMAVGQLQSHARKGMNGLDVKAKPAPYAIEKDPFGSMKAASVQSVEKWAREMAQDDATKIAHAQQAFAVGDAAGRMMAKQAAGMGDLGTAIIKHVKKHPEHLTAAAGAVAGGVSGMSGPDGGVVKGLAGAAAGGATGYGAGMMGKNLLKGHDLKSSATRSLAGAKSDARKVGIIGKTKKPEPPANQLYDS